MVFWQKGPDTVFNFYNGIYKESVLLITYYLLTCSYTNTTLQYSTIISAKTQLFETKYILSVNLIELLGPWESILTASLEIVLEHSALVLVSVTRYRGRWIAISTGVWWRHFLRHDIRQEVFLLILVHLSPSSPSWYILLFMSGSHQAIIIFVSRITSV